MNLALIGIAIVLAARFPWLFLVLAAIGAAFFVGLIP
jgi:hypothetical protein